MNITRAINVTSISDLAEHWVDKLKYKDKLKEHLKREIKDEYLQFVQGALTNSGDVSIPVSTFYECIEARVERAVEDWFAWPSDEAFQKGEGSK